MKRWLPFALNLLLIVSAQAENSFTAPHISVKLVSDKPTLSDGPVKVGALFSIEDGWHIYAKEPGDVGLPTKVTLKSELPLEFGATEYPEFKTAELDGLKSNFYESEVLLPAVVSAKGDVAKDGVITASLSWVLCKDECIRSATKISLPLANGSFPKEAVVSSAFASKNVGANSKGASSLLAILVSAFIGGLILNLMPCVFPVLSLKVLSLLEHAHAKEGRIHSLIFSAGVILSFLTLGALLLSLRSFGMQVGWGFQFQSPMFVALMTLLVVAIGLNLSGLFEVGLSVQSKAGSIKTGNGYGGSFANGVLATALATPCTAPFMGSALAASLVMPIWSAFSIFIALGVGMAAPYITLAIAPQLGKFLPRPGAWMETFKQTLAFPMYATAVWLLYVLATQGGPLLVARVGFGIVTLAMALWIIGKWGALHCSRKTAIRAKVVGGAFAMLAIFISAGSIHSEASEQSARPSVASGSEVQWENFSKERIAQLINNKENFVIDFTAAWCLVCQVNESRVFKSDSVQKLVKEKGIKLIKADWTSKDADITEALSKYGRNSVPLVVVHDRDGKAQPFESLISVNDFMGTLQKM